MNDTSRVIGDGHARCRERLGVKRPGPTRWAAMPVPYRDCARINRYGVEVESASRETCSEPLGPEFCTGRCEVFREA